MPRRHRPAGSVSGTRAVLAVACLAVTVLVGLTAPAGAFELFGIHLWGEREEEIPNPDAIRYEVTVDVVDGGGLASAVRGASELYGNRNEPAASTPALLAMARGDYARLLAAMYAQGHYSVVISIRVAGREADTIPVDATLPEPVPIAIAVDPGPGFAFGEVDIRNRPGPIPGDLDAPPTPEEVGLVAGDPALSTRIIAAEGALVGRWRERGYPKARVGSRTVVARHPARQLDVGITMEPGRPAVFGPTSVRGTSLMNPRFVAWYAGIPQGARFDPDDIDEARARLRRLEVFQAMRFVEAEEIGSDGELPIEIVVTERKPRGFGVGASYATIDGIGAEAFWVHRNLFGQAERLRVEGRVSGLNSQNIEDFNYRAAISFLKPGVFTRDTDLIATVFGERDNPDTYLAHSVGGRLGVQHRFSRTLTGSLFASGVASTITDTPIGDGDFVLASLPARLTFDNRDDKLDPKRGFAIIGDLEPFYEFDRENVGLISGIDGSTYLTPDPDERVTFAFRVAAGSIAGVPQDDMPANRLFFAGGGGSIRGYPWRGVGPLVDGDIVVGGRSLFLTSAEARVRVTETIGVVPFVDAGNAFASEFPDFDEDLRVGVGLGLRYFTALGPLRFDVAFPLDPLPGDPDVAFYLGIGQAF